MQPSVVEESPYSSYEVQRGNYINFFYHTSPLPFTYLTQKRKRSS